MNYTHLLNSAQYAFVASVLMVALFIGSFFMFEPSVSRALDSNQFTVTQQITDEISFLVQPSNVTMQGSLTGITGGYATGTTKVVVRSNDPQGYNMRLFFATTSSGHSMQASSTAYISDYTPASAGVPDYNWITNSSGASAEFGYSVTASSSAEIDQSFVNNGTLCNVAGTNDANKCWMNPSTSPEMIINSSAPSISSTTTINFKVAVPSNPSPALPAAYYTATGTLTATNNP